MPDKFASTRPYLDTNLPAVRPFCFSYRQLREMGWTRRQIEKAVQQGQLFRVARGWYAEADAPQFVIAALRRGHRITCFTALRMWGIWVLDHDAAHEFCRNQTYTGRAPMLIRRHYRPSRWPSQQPVAPLLYSMRDALRCGTAEESAIALESAINLGFLGMSEALDLVAELPRHRRRELGSVSALSQSGTETRVHRFLDSLRCSYRQQAQLTPEIRVDFLVGSGLVIECDSAAFHAERRVGRARTQYFYDRQRDHALHALGFQVIRLSYEQVIDGWDETRLMLRRTIAAKHHLRPLFNAG